MFGDKTLSSRRVLVTAGASGIGLAIARAFRGAGAKVFVCDVDEAALAAARKSLPGLQGISADVSDEASVAALFEAADACLGGLDILVNNAGVAGPTGGVETLSLADWRRTLDVNITGQFLCARLAVPRLRRGVNPSILNLSSAAGHLGFPGRSPYSASKWAVVGFTKSLAIELGADGIRVNAILPGAVDGPRIRAVIAAKAATTGLPLEAVTHAYESQAALGRMVTAEDIANMALFAVSDAAINLSGQELVVDGHTQKLS
ncbi:SDR family oxidoreductase [Orrella dioscoreae]|uniref:Short chain dehydrogenase n=1 Tax=Orrella dioscoreae TaxID=1851544 RepID=A0A1C3K464_9BURK|nr:SDR family oxidoreductase [Orrella dioscoreae]SBT26296.1 Short chain dehydrogenase [Orrella dioscoreae]SOE47080.1 Short chain dehydrogenase [Orrella dioscoreae]